MEHHEKDIEKSLNPISLFTDNKGRFRAGGASLDKIIAASGAPAYLYDAAIMRVQYKKLLSSLPANSQIHFSVKANPNIAIAEVFRRMGAGAEVASKSELSMALSAGFKPDKIIFAGPGKGADELALAIKHHIGSINIESQTELDTIEKISRSKGGKPTRIAFRVNLDLAVDHGKMVGGPRKFGIDAEAVEPLVKKTMASPNLVMTGFHCYPGTQILNASDLGKAYRVYVSWADKLASQLKLKVKILNFGGGLGIPYRESEKELDIKVYGTVLANIKKKLAKSKWLNNAAILLEPGRYLVGPAGVYISEVTDMKMSCGTQFIITNGGIHHALLPITLNKSYPTAILNKLDKRKTVKCILAGPLCLSPDQFSREVTLPTPQIGDLVGIFNSGAYGYSASMLSFLSHPTPTEALVDKGKIDIIRKSKKTDHGIARHK